MYVHPGVKANIGLHSEPASGGKLVAVNPLANEMIDGDSNINDMGFHTRACTFLPGTRSKNLYLDDFVPAILALPQSLGCVRYEIRRAFETLAEFELKFDDRQFFETFERRRDFRQPRAVGPKFYI